MAAPVKAGISLIPRGTSVPAGTTLTGVSVTRSGTIATYTKTSHGYTNGEIVQAENFSLEEFNTVGAVSNVTANTWDMTIKQDPGANPSGTTGTSRKVLVGSTWDMSATFGGLIVGLFENGNTGPTTGAELWVGYAISNNAYDYRWERMMTGEVTANLPSRFTVRIPRDVLYARVMIAGNTGQAVDCYAEGHETTSIG